MTAPRKPYITCGMYAFTTAQQRAWRQLFDRFFEASGLKPGAAELRFEHEPAALRQPGLWFGHTCGYPLMTQLQDYVAPFCVPVFDVAGTDGRLYSSRIIVAADSDIELLEDGRGRVCAINNPDSNSGMNVLRHALADIAKGRPFFSRVISTGGHLHSLQAVADGLAAIAAIDCVSFQLIADSQPELASRVKVIGNTVSSCGLPLVMAREISSSVEVRSITDRLNQALASCEDEVKNTLHLTGFAGVDLEDYRSILQVEQYAIERGYPELA